jgi:hypothetical protein
VGLLIRDRPTLRDSIAVLIRYHAALNGSLSIMLEESAGVVVVRVRPRLQRHRLLEVRPRREERQRRSADGALCPAPAGRDSGGRRIAHQFGCSPTQGRAAKPAP